MLYQLSYIGSLNFLKRYCPKLPAQHQIRRINLQSVGFAPARSSSIRVRQKYSTARKANSPRITNVPVRSLTFALKTRIGSSDSVVQAKTPSAAYAIRASTNFFLIVNA